jgi:hypothetical protein
MEKITPTWVLYKEEFSGILLLVIAPPLFQSPAPSPLSLTVAFHCCSTLINNRPPTPTTYYVADRTNQCLFYNHGSHSMFTFDPAFE